MVLDHSSAAYRFFPSEKAEAATYQDPWMGAMLPTLEASNDGVSEPVYTSTGYPLPPLIGTSSGEHKTFLDRSISACRFFPSEEAFEAEAVTYQDPVMGAMLPTPDASNDGVSEPVYTSTGYRLPPFLVLPRGTLLADLCDRNLDAVEVLLMVCDVASLLQGLHGKGYVLTNLNPANLLFLPRRHQWRLASVRNAMRTGASSLAMDCGVCLGLSCGTRCFIRMQDHALFFCSMIEHVSSQSLQKPIDI
jgi:hypothetical protein